MYDDNSVEVFPDRMLVKNHPIELPVGDILHCNGELGINLAPAEGKYFTWCDPLYLVLQLNSENQAQHLLWKMLSVFWYSPQNHMYDKESDQ